jgi:hypothetical protein
MSREANEEYGRIKHYKTNKMSGIATNLSIIILNANVFNFPSLLPS